MSREKKSIKNSIMTIKARDCVANHKGPKVYCHACSVYRRCSFKSMALRHRGCTHAPTLFINKDDISQVPWFKKKKRKNFNVINGKINIKDYSFGNK